MSLLAFLPGSAPTAVTNGQGRAVKAFSEGSSEEASDPGWVPG